MSTQDRIQNNVSIQALLVLAILIAGLANCLPSHAAPTHPRYRTSPGGWQWTTLAWTGDDRPYAALQSAIDAEIAEGMKIEYFQRRYHQAALRNPTDPVAQFADVYSTLKSLKAWHSRMDLVFAALQQADDQVGRARDPRAYHYERERYIIEAGLIGFDPHLRALGERLLDRDPLDTHVKYALIHMLGSRPGEDALAIRYCSDIVKADPNDADNYTVVAGYYWRRFDRSHAKADGDEAIADYNRFLKLAPADDWFRLAANYAVSRIQKEMAKYDQ